LEGEGLIRKFFGFRKFSYFIEFDFFWRLGVRWEIEKELFSVCKEIDIQHSKLSGSGKLNLSN
jgi:hypothetical protein